MKVNTSSPFLYLIESGKLCFPSEVSHWLLMEDPVFLSPHSRAPWSCARREEKREGEVNNAFLGQRPRFISLSWPKGRKKTRCYPSRQFRGDMALLPLEGTKPGCHGAQHKFQVTCLVMHKSSGQFKEFTLWIDQNFLLKKIQRPPSESCFNFKTQAM